MCTSPVAGFAKTCWRLKLNFHLYDQWPKGEYEMGIVSALPECYVKLAAYREQIQLANRKFCWPSVYLFYVQTRVHVASHKDVHPRLEVLEMIKATILDKINGKP